MVYLSIRLVFLFMIPQFTAETICIFIQPFEFLTYSLVCHSAASKISKSFLSVFAQQIFFFPVAHLSYPRITSSAYIGDMIKLLLLFIPQKYVRNGMDLSSLQINTLTFSRLKSLIFHSPPTSLKIISTNIAIRFKCVLS